MSIAALVAVTLYNNLNNTITALQAGLARANEARSELHSEMRTEFGKVAEARAELIRKDEFNTRLNQAYERIQAMQSQDQAEANVITSFKSDIEAMKERTNKAAADLDLMRKESAIALEALKKEQTTTTDAIKKDMAALDVLRDRLATVAAEVKAEREDFTKLRQEVDKNQAYDFERRDRRDAQMKEYDALVKEMQKTMQDCRERVARMEAVMSTLTPAAPVATPAQPTSTSVTPAGGFPASLKKPTRAATPAQPQEIELAPAPRKVQ